MAKLVFRILYELTHLSKASKNARRSETVPISCGDAQGRAADCTEVRAESLVIGCSVSSREQAQLQNVRRNASCSSQAESALSIASSSCSHTSPSGLMPCAWTTLDLAFSSFHKHNYFESQHCLEAPAFCGG